MSQNPSKAPERVRYVCNACGLPFVIEAKDCKAEPAKCPHCGSADTKKTW
jgi:DNA-directed RNA polymerase subunit RPC12/RpoP